MIIKTLKVVSGLFLFASFAAFSSAIDANGELKQNEAQMLIAHADMFDKQIHRTVNAFKNSNLDVALFVRQDNAYYALFSSIEGLRFKELDPDLIAQIQDDGVFVGQDVMIQDYLCDRVVLKRSQDEDEIYFVGKNCQLERP